MTTLNRLLPSRFIDPVQSFLSVGRPLSKKIAATAGAIGATAGFFIAHHNNFGLFRYFPLITTVIATTVETSTSILKDRTVSIKKIAQSAIVGAEMGLPAIMAQVFPICKKYPLLLMTGLGLTTLKAFKLIDSIGASATAGTILALSTGVFVHSLLLHNSIIGNFIDNDPYKEFLTLIIGSIFLSFRFQERQTYQPNAQRDFINAIIRNAQDARPDIISDLSMLDPDAIMRFTQAVVEQLIQAPSQPSRENTPRFLHKILNKINSLRLRYHQLSDEEKTHFSLEYRPDLSVAVRNLAHDARNLAGRLFSGPDQISPQVFSIVQQCATNLQHRSWFF